MVVLNVHPQTLAEIARELYAPSHIGAAALPDAISPEFRTRLVTQLKTVPFERAPAFYKNTAQDFLRFSSETQPIATLPPSLDALAELAAAHEKLYTEIGTHCGFQKTTKTTYSAHHYPLHSHGLGSHRDESAYKNLIAIYVILGDRAFTVANNRDLAGGVHILNPQGSIILMRAPRTDDEKKLRPYHAVEGPFTERISVLFRHEVSL